MKEKQSSRKCAAPSTCLLIPACFKRAHALTCQTWAPRSLFACAHLVPIALCQMSAAGRTAEQVVGSCPIPATRLRVANLIRKGSRRSRSLGKQSDHRQHTHTHTHTSRPLSSAVSFFCHAPSFPGRPPARAETLKWYFTRMSCER